MTRRKLNSLRKLDGIQQLETRQLMAADIDLTNGVLEIQGTHDNDVIEIRFDDSNNVEIEIESYDDDGNEVDDTDRDFDLDDVQSIRVRALGGNDHVRIFHEDEDDTTNLDNLFSLFEVDGGAGEDLIENETEAAFNAFGGDHDDTIRGGSGHDRIYGGYGRDWLEGGAGNDKILGQAGHDDIYGQAGNDTLYGHNSNLWQSNNALDSDSIYGGQGMDWLYGGGGSDNMYGADGANPDTDTHTNYIYGDDGSDNLQGGSMGDYIFGGNGVDNMIGHGGRDRMYGGADTDFMFGGAGEDFLHGNGGLDHLHGGEDNDRLDGGLDGYEDHLTGGSGRDVFVRHGHYAPGYGRTLESEDVQDFSRYEGDFFAYSYRSFSISSYTLTF